MKSILAAALCLALASCATSSIAPPAKKGTVDHVVLMWQKRPGNTADRAKLSAACDELRALDGIQFLDHGTALPSERPVVDDSFDLGMVVRFDSAKSLHTYETDPRHVKKVNEVLKPLTKRIQVYDIIR